MDIVIICISLEGHDERAAWSALLIEPEGFVEERCGLASSLRRAILWALKETIPSVSAGSRVAIRSTSTLLLRMEAELKRLQKEGSEGDPDHDLIDLFLYKLRQHEVAWIDATRYQQLGDQRAQKLAKETLNDFYMALPPDEIDFISREELPHSAVQAVPQTEYEREHIETAPETTALQRAIPQTEYEKQQLEKELLEMQEEVEKEGLETQEEVEPDPLSEPAPTAEAAPPPTTEPDTEEEHSLQIPLIETPAPQPAPEPPPKAVRPPRKHTAKPKPKGPKTLDLPPSPDFLFGPRIVAYIDGVCAGSLGGWAFVLVDRQSGNALLRASGVRSASPYRIRLLSCIEVLSAIKAEKQAIEIRSRWQNIIKLGSQWMWNWEAKGWKKSGGKTIEELGFVQQLFSLSQTQRLQWRYVPDRSDDYGMILVKNLAKRALNDINNGNKVLIDRRQRNFPIDRLL